MRRLEGRVAIVTGAGRGIGRVLALGMAREGASVVVAEMDEERALEVQKEVEESGRQGLAVPTDVSREESVNAMVERCVGRFGKIDILVNNAGICSNSPVEKMEEEEWDRVIGTNLVGTFLCSRAVTPIFLERGKGRIINISSGRALKGALNCAHYAASKAGMIGFTKALALELAPHGTTVNAVCPGMTDTGKVRLHNNKEEGLPAGAAKIPFGRIGRPEDLVEPVLFLASDAAVYVTGQALPVNGGNLMF